MRYHGVSVKNLNQSSEKKVYASIVRNYSSGDGHRTISTDNMLIMLPLWRRRQLNVIVAKIPSVREGDPEQASCPRCVDILTPSWPRPSPPQFAVRDRRRLRTGFQVRGVVWSLVLVGPPGPTDCADGAARRPEDPGTAPPPQRSARPPSACCSRCTSRSRRRRRPLEQSATPRPAPAVEARTRWTGETPRRCRRTGKSRRRRAQLEQLSRSRKSRR